MIKKSIDDVACAYWENHELVCLEDHNIDTGLINQKISNVLFEYLIEGILEEIE